VSQTNRIAFRRSGNKARNEETKFFASEEGKKKLIILAVRHRNPVIKLQTFVFKGK
jgi:hypothetical protein